MKKKLKRICKTKKRRRILRNRYLWSFIIGTIIIITLIYFFCFSSFFEIKEIKVESNEKVDAVDIINLSKEKLVRNFLFFDTKNIFLADFTKLEEDLLKNFIQIAAVGFSKNYPDNLTLFIKEREPVVVFKQGDDYFFIDDKGIIFERALDNYNLLLIKSNELEKEVEIGESLIEEKKLDKILTSYNELSDLEIKTIFVEIISYQRFNIKTDEGWDIYFNLEGDISQQILNLNLILKEEISLEKRDVLEYIDLRFGNQVYYK